MGATRKLPPLRRGGSSLGFASLVITNVRAKKIRLALTVLAIAIGVMTVVSLVVLTASLRTSDLAIMQMGRADFTISQKGVADVLSSTIDETRLEKIAATPHVAAATGVLLTMERLNADNPLFLEIGLAPVDQGSFGVTIVSGRSYTAGASDEIMLGWRAAENLHLSVGDRMTLQGSRFRIVGLYSTGQAQGDSGAMFPLTVLQTHLRQTHQVTLIFVRATPGANVVALQRTIDEQNPQLVTVRTVEEFGRADRSLSLIQAAADGSTLLAIVIGAIVVMSAMSMSFVERIREFGVLSAIGWDRWRIWAMILSEAVVMGVLGAAVGAALSVLAMQSLQHMSDLRGVLQPQFTAGVFARALFTAAAMSLLGGILPAWRAAHIAPLEALSHE